MYAFTTWEIFFIIFNSQRQIDIHRLDKTCSEKFFPKIIKFILHSNVFVHHLKDLLHYFQPTEENGYSSPGQNPQWKILPQINHIVFAFKCIRSPLERSLSLFQLPEENGLSLHGQNPQWKILPENNHIVFAFKCFCSPLEWSPSLFSTNRGKWIFIALTKPAVKNSPQK